MTSGTTRGRERPDRQPTMLDVAQMAGVSQTTVSFVINDVATASISQETKDRVWEAVEALGYRVNYAARGLRTRQSHTIGFVTDEIATSPFAGDVIRGAQEVAWANGKMLLVLNTEGIGDVERAAVETMLERQVEGIVYAAMFTRVAEPPAALRELPSMLMNCFTSDRSLPSVIPDEVTGGRTATEVLLARGHRRIAFINGEPWYVAAQERLEGYRQALDASGRTFDERLVRHGNWRPDSGYRHTLELMRLDPPPTAIFAGNDLMAIGVYQALAGLGLRVPQDVAVVGYDDQEIAAYLQPPLTTMALPHYEMGQWAIQYLLEASARVPAVQARLEVPLIERDSV